MRKRRVSHGTWLAGTIVALTGLGLEPSFGQVPARELPGEMVSLKGDAIVFVFRVGASQTTTTGESRPAASDVARLRASVGDVRRSLRGSGIEVREEKAFKYSWGTSPKTRGQTYLSPGRDFIGTLFFKEGKRSAVHQGSATATEILLRAEEFFGQPLPVVTSPEP